MSPRMINPEDEFDTDTFHSEQEEQHNLLTEELMQYRDNWANSYEDGWFYTDKD